MPDAPGDAPLGEGMLPPGDTETMVRLFLDVFLFFSN